MEWLPILGFPKYSVSDRGEVRRNANQRIVKPQVNQAGVPYVVLMREYTHFSRGLARLVAKAFLPHPPKAFDTPINLDGDRFNCAVENLMWRPRWFAIQYHRQFIDGPGVRINRPLRALEDEKVYSSSLEAAIAYGALEIDLVNSVFNGTYVWPTNQQFEIA